MPHWNSEENTKIIQQSNLLVYYSAKQHVAE